jgi:NAD(P)-dependent dehydrogenase (short-subunit alcohol dehydrogenase family)
MSWASARRSVRRTCRTPTASTLCPSKRLKRLGGLDILISNAGVTRDGLLMRMKDEDWDTVIKVNLEAHYRLSKAALRGMMKQRFGRIIGITSVVGVMGNAGQTNYAASKAGMIGFHQIAGPGSRGARRDRELRGAGLYRIAHDRRAE